MHEITFAFLPYLFLCPSSRLALEGAPGAEGQEEGQGKDKKAVLSDLLESDVVISPEQALAAVL